MVGRAGYGVVSALDGIRQGCLWHRCELLPDGREALRRELEISEQLWQIRELGVEPGPGVHTPDDT
jgi:hypothetical protein